MRRAMVLTRLGRLAVAISLSSLAGNAFHRSLVVEKAECVRDCAGGDLRDG